MIEFKDSVFRAFTLVRFSLTCLAGRNYLARNGDLIASLITCLKMEPDDPLTQDHALGCLQRLSLKFVCFIYLL